MTEDSGPTPLRQGTGAPDRPAWIRAATEGHPWLRGILVLGMAGSLVATWPLWQARSDYPLPLSRFELPAVDFGFALLACLALVLLRPRIGLAALILVWVTSAVFDELRIQPPLFSPSLLLFATLRGRGPRLIGWASLSAMWFYAGLHKVLSDVYLENFGFGVVQAAFPGVSLGVRDAVSWTVAVGEMVLGAMLWWPRLRKATAVLGGTLHGSIAVILPWIAHNQVVWPWATAFSLVTPVVMWHAAPTLREQWSTSWLPRSVAVLLLVSPIGVCFEVLNPYLGYNLYAGNATRAVIYSARSEPVPLKFLSELNCFVPATRWNFVHLFQQRCKPGDKLILEDPRWWVKRQGRAKETVHCGQLEE